MDTEGITQIAQISEIAPNRLARHGKPLSQTLHLYPPVTFQHGKDLFLSCRQIHAPLRRTSPPDPYRHHIRQKGFPSQH